MNNFKETFKDYVIHTNTICFISPAKSLFFLSVAEGLCKSILIVGLDQMTIGLDQITAEAN